MQQINRSKNKNHIIISTNTEKASDKIQHPFMIKALKILETERLYLDTIKDTYDKPTANIFILNGEKWKRFL
jgi:hypothetical protein